MTEGRRREGLALHPSEASGAGEKLPRINMKNNARTRGKGKKLGFRTPSSFRSDPRRGKKAAKVKVFDNRWS